MAIIPLILLPFLSSAIVPVAKMAKAYGNSRSISPSPRSSTPCAGC